MTKRLGRSASRCVVVLTQNYGVSFPIMAKSDVNGAHANEVFKFLKHEKKGMLGIEAISTWSCTHHRVELYQGRRSVPLTRSSSWTARAMS